VLFLQNHDQIGNRAFGERLSQLCSEPALRAATTLLLLSPMIPLMFMGDEWAAKEPFLFFTSHHGELADAVREGRRSEFAAFSVFADPHKRETIPDPNAASTFDDSRPHFESFPLHQNGPWVELYRELLTWRRREIFPRLSNARSLGAEVLADKAITARWRMGDGVELRIDLNLGEQAIDVELPDASLRLFDSRLQPDNNRKLTPYTTLVSLIPPEFHGSGGKP
jgi:maltooligosyltrehalose trehalohydrolase